MPSSSSSSTQQQNPDPDPDLLALLTEFSLETSSSSSSPSPQTKNQNQPEHNDQQHLPASCLTAFDEMFYCYSLGGQFLNIYRYGSLRNCSEKSADWRFCMKTKVRGDVARRAMILSRNREKAAKYKTGSSSEDIWNVRKSPLENAFLHGDMKSDMKDNGGL